LSTIFVQNVNLGASRSFYQLFVMSRGSQPSSQFTSSKNVKISSLSLHTHTRTHTHAHAHRYTRSLCFLSYVKTTPLLWYRATFTMVNWMATLPVTLPFFSLRLYAVSLHYDNFHYACSRLWPMVGSAAHFVVILSVLHLK
jgi:hypothetical protein